MREFLFFPISYNSATVLFNLSSFNCFFLIIFSRSIIVQCICLLTDCSCYRWDCNILTSYFSSYKDFFISSSLYIISLILISIFLRFCLRSDISADSSRIMSEGWINRGKFWFTNTCSFSFCFLRLSAVDKSWLTYCSFWWSNWLAALIVL